MSAAATRRSNRRARRAANVRQPSTRELLERALDIARQLDNEGRREASLRTIAGVLDVIEGALVRRGVEIPEQARELTRRMRAGEFTLDQEGEPL